MKGVNVMKWGSIILIIALSLCSQLCLATVTQSYQSTVVRVADGNTLIVSNKVLRGNITMTGEATIILDGIRAPHLDQPKGAAAKTFLQELVKGREVFVVEYTDMGKSRGAWVYIGDSECVNLLLAEEGYAWSIPARAHFAVSIGKPKESYRKMKAAFQKAKEQKKGIWADDNPIPPWEWIKNHPKKEEAQPEE